MESKAFSKSINNKTPGNCNDSAIMAHANQFLTVCAYESNKRVLHNLSLDLTLVDLSKSVTRKTDHLQIPIIIIRGIRKITSLKESFHFFSQCLCLASLLMALLMNLFAPQLQQHEVAELHFEDELSFNSKIWRSLFESQLPLQQTRDYICTK